MAFGKCTSCEALRAELTTERARYEALLDKYHSLRLAGHEPVGKLRVIPPREDSGMQAIRAGERAFTDPRMAKAFAELVAEGVPEADALREAARLVEIGTGKRQAATVTELAGQ